MYMALRAGRIILTPAARAFKKECEKQLKNVAKISGEVRVNLEFHWADGRVRDVDNYLKMTLDSLKNAMFNDDSCVVELRCTKKLRSDKIGVDVTVEQI
jgi:Holliday junction resolvase RusA-like endonuclease